MIDDDWEEGCTNWRLGRKDGTGDEHIVGYGGARHYCSHIFQKVYNRVYSRLYDGDTEVGLFTDTGP